MIQLKWISSFFMAIMLVTIVGCGATPTRESTGEFIDDSTITTKVKAAILETPALKTYEINVETFKGVVQLSGFVSTQDEITKAVDVAERVKGVKSVKNSMRLK
ncbi:MAG: BON domain-containing protein [Pseudomonadota bacterium]